MGKGESGEEKKLISESRHGAEQASEAMDEGKGDAQKEQDKAALLQTSRDNNFLPNPQSDVQLVQIIAGLNASSSNGGNGGPPTLIAGVNIVAKPGSTLNEVLSEADDMQT